jgi:hypothetical protein
MTVLDKDLQLSDSQALTTTAVATNVIDLSVARNLSGGEPISVVFYVEVAADQTTGDEDYTFDVEIATDAAQTTGVQLMGRRVFESGTPTAPAQNADLLVAGFSFAITIPPVSGDEIGRYLGVRYTLAGTSPTITVSTYLQPECMVDNEKVNYASGYAVS